jgi:prevent-host-death family protein
LPCLPAPSEFVSRLDRDFCRVSALDGAASRCNVSLVRSERIPPVSTTELSEQAAQLVKRVRETGEAVIVVENGEPAAVLVGATEFAALQEHRRFMAAINDGLADVEAGRVLTTAELKISL